MSSRSPFELAAGRLLAEPPPPGPGWLAELRAAGAAAFHEAGLPTARHEDWRFTNLAPLAALELSRARAGEGALAALASLPPAAGPRLVFENGRLRPDLSSSAGLPKGAVVAGLGEALSHAPELVRPHLGRLARPEGLAFTALNAALLEDGALVLVPAGTALPAPVELVFLAGGGAAGLWAQHPRVLVVAAPGAKATVAEIYLGGGGGYFTGAVSELSLGEGAELEHVRLQDEGEGAFHVGAVFAEQGAGARLSAHSLSLGARLSRAELRVRLAGEEGRLEASGLFMADGSRVTDAFTWVDHTVPRCSTSEAYKGILDGQARGIFAGRIRVMPGAQKTDARQSSSNLLLSDDAVVDTKPQLEIFADDVKCGHGGTVGQLDEEARFYLRSRGLGDAEARSLLIWAFAAEMVERVGAEGLRALARARVACRLPAAVALLEAA
ncbi:MAG TPA: Fe-S cluster assembly protein SufD [Anaeromyxobacter sp.]|nr:Fe-S cluster assembly protein SufD [Anaeromyxobacter sp.]